MIAAHMDAATGSSPRVRGTPLTEATDQLPRRFIPACAGNAPAVVRFSRGTPVHPRVCGERSERKDQRLAISGSSPRVRGTHLPRIGWRLCMRFIPACAGNAIRYFQGVRLSPVHPRVCGERAPASYIFEPRFGSSPRVRGTRACALLRWGCGRFIPACAGNAVSSGPAGQTIVVHPRVCGERGVDGGPQDFRCGSSPRVRGTLATTVIHKITSRFIPACAGNARTATYSQYG